MKNIKYDFKVSYRSLKKHAIPSLLNIFGLSAAFALCILSSILIWDSYSSDSQWKNANNIYQLEQEAFFGGNTRMRVSFLPGALTDIANFSPNIEHAAAAGTVTTKFRLEGNYVEIGGKQVNATFFQMFEAKVLSGSINQALENDGNLVLVKSMASEFFGNDNPIGKTIEFVSNKAVKLYTVAAVVEDFPTNSQFSEARYFTKTAAGKKFGTIYLTLKPSVDIKNLNDNLTELLAEKYPIPPYLANASLKFSALKGEKLDSMKYTGAGIATGGLISSAVILLLVAVFNFIAMSTAVASGRRKDIALRKILGASKANLFVQYISEALMIATLAYIFALGLAFMMVPPFEAILGDHFVIFSVERIPMLLTGWCVALFVGFLSGLYPVLMLTRGKVGVMLNDFQRGVASGGAKVRSLLIFMQSLAGIGLAFVACMIYYQISSLQTDDKGFEMDGLLYIHGAGWTATQNHSHDIISKEIAALEGVDNVTQASLGPFVSGFAVTSILKPKTGEKTSVNITRFRDGYFDFLGVPLLAGRVPQAVTKSESSSERPLTSSVLVNEKFLNKYAMGKPADVIGTCINSVNKDQSGKETRHCYEITGVVADYHSSTGKNPVLDAMYMPSNRIESVIYVRVNTKNLSKTLEKINTIWNGYYPTSVLKYDFADDLMAKGYRSFNTMATLLIFTAIGSLLLTVAGLYGMARFVVLRHYREIAIRRVLGAPSKSIIYIVVVQLMRPAIPGAVIGLSIGWYLVQDWLTGFEVRVQPELWMPVALGALCTAIFLASVFNQILKAVRIRPAEALHYE